MDHKPIHYGYEQKLALPDEFWKLPFMAALIDGEGSIVDEPEKNARIVSVANTSEELMRWLSFNFGGMVGLSSQPTLRRKAQYAWKISNMIDILVLLRAISPFMVIKKQKAESMIALIANKLNYRLCLEGQYAIPSQSAFSIEDIENLWVS